MRRVPRATRRSRIRRTPPRGREPPNRLRSGITVIGSRGAGGVASGPFGVHEAGLLRRERREWVVVTMALLLLVVIDDIIVGNILDRIRRGDVAGAVRYIRGVARDFWPVWLLLAIVIVVVMTVMRLLVTRGEL